MTIQEFSDQFDVLYNNITSNQAPGLDEYEKSLFLTKAEKEIVKNYFTANSKGNTIQQGFDDSAKRQADFSVLMKTNKCDYVSGFGVPQYEFYTRNSQGGKTNIVYPRNVVFTKYMSSTTIIPPIGTYNTVSISPSAYGFRIGNDTCTVSGDGLPEITANTLLDVTEVSRIDPRSAVYSFPTDAYIVINESLYKKDKSLLQIVPLRFDEYMRLMSKPFKRPVKNQAWRLMNSGEVSGSKSVATKRVEVVVNSWDEKAIDSYGVRYIRVPKPIIVADLGELSIDGESNQSAQCEIDPILHDDILQRAVELAKVAWTATGQDNAQTLVQAGQRSE